MRLHLSIVVVVISAACFARPNLPAAALASEMAGPVTGCGGAPGSGTNTVITAAELQHTRASNLYDAIRRLRPDYFTIRGLSSVYLEPVEAIVVIANRHIIGGIDELRSMDVTGLACVRHLPAAEVTLITGTLGTAAGIELVH